MCVRGDSYVDPARTIFVDSITPHFLFCEQTGVTFSGDLFVGPHDTHVENVLSNWYGKTKYLEATSGAIGNQIAVTPDLAMLNEI